MSQEQISMIGILYLTGMIVYSLWYFIRNGGYKGWKKQATKLGKTYGISVSVILTAAIILDVIGTLAWPIFMHIGMKERLRS